MNLEQVTFRVGLGEEHFDTFVHLIHLSSNRFSVKINDIEMSTDEFAEYVNQLSLINISIAHVKQFAEKVNV